jgi:hypothetical protein
MSKLDTLRKLIREEVKAAIQEQLAEILKEAITINSAGRQRVMETATEQPHKPQQIPGTLNTRTAPLVAPKLASGNPLNNLLSETARSMTTEDISTYNFNSNNVHGFAGGIPMQTETSAVSSVDQMLATARPSMNFDMVEINAVPDFTELMGNLRAKGVL